MLNGLGVTRFDGNVVTDALHFDGALVHLLELQKQGLDLRVVKPRDYRIDMRDLEKVVDKKTKLIEVSLVAMYNGFQHDLKAVCDLAHAHGALVYADIIQGAGAVPIDVRATGLDFAACSSFKWLMGDFGLGFLYAREGALEHVARSQWGYHSTSDMNEHVPPFDPEADTKPVSWTLSNDATGMFEVGSIGGSVKAAVGASLAYIQSLGVENIQAHRQPLLKKLRDEMPRLGFTPVTPPESTSPIITFAMKDGAAVQRKLDAAKVNARVQRALDSAVAVRLQRPARRRPAAGGAVVIRAFVARRRRGIATAARPCARAAGAAVRTPIVAVSKHTGQFDGQAVRYTATVAEHFVKDSLGHADRVDGDDDLRLATTCAIARRVR